jgi:hypothetical protein
VLSQSCRCQKNNDTRKRRRKLLFLAKGQHTHAGAFQQEPEQAIVMAPTTRASYRNWAVSRATALPEFWNLVAEHSGLVGAWRLTGVCRASRVGAKQWLRTLRRLVVSGGYVSNPSRTIRKCWEERSRLERKRVKISNERCSRRNSPTRTSTWSGRLFSSRNF